MSNTCGTTTGKQSEASSCHRVGKRRSGMKPKVRARAAELRGHARDFFKIKIYSIFFLHLL